jgi:hypothetical protein
MGTDSSVAVAILTGVAGGATGVWACSVELQLERAIIALRNREILMIVIQISLQNLRLKIQDGIILGDIADLDWSTAHLTILDVDLTSD